MNIIIPEITRREIFRVALMRGLTMRKISEMTGINYKTVWAFFRHGVGQRKTVEKIIENMTIFRTLDLEEGWQLFHFPSLS
jgi:hypothetical protein